MKIKDMPKECRPRERFLKLGPQALSEAELFAILLRTGSRGKKDSSGIYEAGENIIDISNRLINEYGLDHLLECSLTELQKIKGIGQSKAMQILTISELQKRINHAKHQIKKITCANDVFNLMNDTLKDEKQEHFYTLLLDTKNNLVKEPVLISKGILDASIIHPREVFNPAIRNSASKIILVHNHPSGDASPSQEDLKITEKLCKAGTELGINVLDSLIIGRESYWSWAEKQISNQ